RTPHTRLAPSPPPRRSSDLDDRERHDGRAAARPPAERGALRGRLPGRLAHAVDALDADRGGALALRARGTAAALAPHVRHPVRVDRKSTRLNSSHVKSSYAV